MTGTHAYLVSQGRSAAEREALAQGTCAAIMADVLTGATLRGAETYGDLTAPEMAIVTAISDLAGDVLDGRVNFDDASGWDRTDAIVSVHESFVLSQITGPDDFDAELDAFLRSLGEDDAADRNRRARRAQWDEEDDEGYMY
jgi:hypothetical protein